MHEREDAERLATVRERERIQREVKAEDAANHNKKSAARESFTKELKEREKQIIMIRERRETSREVELQEEREEMARSRRAAEELKEEVLAKKAKRKVQLEVFRVCSEYLGCILALSSIPPLHLSPFSTRMR